MNILDRYIARTIVSGTLMTLLVLGSLLAFVDFVSEIGNVGKGQYTILNAVSYVLLSLPKRLYELFPTAVLLGSLLSLGTLASNSELIVVRASGISIMRIVRSVLQAGLIVVILVALIGEFIVPGSERQAQTIRAVALKQNISLGQHGFWAKDGQLYINVGRVYPDYQLGNLEIYELDENKQLKQLIHARSAHYNNGSWLLKNVQRTQLLGDSISSDRLKTLEWPRVLNPDLFNVVSVKPTTMSAIDLYRYSNYLRTNDLDASHYQLAFWIKVMTPLSSMVMLLIALPFVFGSQRSTGSGYRVLIGLLLGIGFFMLNRTVNHLGQIYGLHPFISASAPVILVAIAGMLAIRKVH